MLTYTLVFVHRRQTKILPKATFLDSGDLMKEYIHINLTLFFLSIYCQIVIDINLFIEPWQDLYEYYN